MTEIFNKLADINPWGNGDFDFGIERTEYLNKIMGLQGNNLIKVLMGQRRSGKSYILRQIMRCLIEQKGVNTKNIFYLNKEFAEFSSIKNAQDLMDLIEEYKKQLNPDGQIYIFLDEVQEIQEWEKIVNSYAQQANKKYELFISGSNSNMLSTELATFLSGRYVAFEIFSFNFNEYCLIKKIPKSGLSFREYLQDGGLPQLSDLNTRESKIYYVKSLRDTIILKDIIERHKIKNIAFLEQLFYFLVDNIGNIFSIKSITDYLNNQKSSADVETVGNYISYLKETFLFHEVKRYDLKGKRILDYGVKYYVNDLAFKNYLTSGFDPGQGKMLENALFLYFKSQGYQVYIGKIGDFEVDFVLEKNNIKKYVQVSYSIADSKVAEREFRALEKIPDSWEKMVISLDDVSFGQKDGIKHLVAWELN